MLESFDQPIIAISTAQGRGAVGIVRLSAPSLDSFVKALLGRDLKPREATYLPIADTNGVAIDRGIAIYFKAPHSYTGEDVLELQVHGGQIVLDLIVARCFAVTKESAVLDGLRLARAGEFTQRAFLNGKMNLTQAEAVSDLINASTEAAVRSAGRSLDGEFSKQVEQLKKFVIQLRMLVEATLDFPEEEVDFLQKADAKGKLENIIKTLVSIQRKAKQGCLLRDGLTVVIAGQPNAGKSSLLNALAGAELAIVTPIAGTTRDKITQTIQIEGVPIHVVDTAGLRQEADTIEKIGMERAWQAIEKADAVLFVHDLSRVSDVDYQQADNMIADNLKQTLPVSTVVLDVWNKLDLVKDDVKNHEGIVISISTGEGLELLRNALLNLAGWQVVENSLFMARQRHLQALLEVREKLDLAALHLNQKADNLDLLAEELRQAQKKLSQITGEFTTENLLSVIFKEFCIGK